MNELALVKGSVLSGQPNETQMYCSFPLDTVEAKTKVYNAVMNTEENLRDIINKELTIVDIYAEPIQLENEETKEMQDLARIVIFDDKGVSYNSVSNGVRKSITTLIALFGDPSTWKEGQKVVVKQKSIGKNQMLYLELA